MISITLKQLAQQLGLSASTVSRALHDSYEISEDTKQRVRAMAAELNYRPHPYASSLRSKVSKTIAVVVPEVANHFFSLAINGIEEIARHNDYHVLIYLTHDSYASEVNVAQYLTGGRVDGILMSLASESTDFAHLDKLSKLEIPIVFFDRVCSDMATASVTTDDYASGYRATEHLIEAGCRSIAYLLMSANLSIGNKRLAGYTNALQHYDIAYDEELILDGSGTNEENQALIAQLLAQRPEIDGIFASVERLAMSSYHACQTLGRRIPEQVKIIGFSNLETASLLAPALTTITQPAYGIGHEAARILFQAIIKNKPVLKSQSVEFNYYRL